MRHQAAGPIGQKTALPLYDGVPYLLVRIVGALRHITLLPAAFSRERLVGFGQRQLSANRLEGALVLNLEQAVAYRSDGTPQADVPPPRGGILVPDRLAPPEAIPDSEELVTRRERLAVFMAQSQPHDGCLLGDLTKGGRAASLWERLRLTGIPRGGVPHGLRRCPVCQFWAGQCLDPAPQFRGQLMLVQCRCQNDNRCARCGDPLATFRLNANYYDERDGQIWHVPGFSAFSHRCRFVDAGGPDDITAETGQQGSSGSE